jgi:S-DNA-T family DNA segregation ATPase FtsK/SpoIIIE
MRRQARLARRSGLQPMMVINTGDAFPETVGVVLLRGAWRYRSELAPVGVTAGLVAAAWWLHRTRPHWWFAVAVLAGVAAWAVALFGARWRLPALSERVYAAVTIYAGGIWLSVAIAIGPFFRPLLQAGIIAALILSVPWWAHRRRRAKVRLERKLSAWPDIAKAVGLAGAEVMSATVDVWGWRARFRLARGQTIKDVTAKIPAIESGLGTVRNAVRVYPTPDAWPTGARSGCSKWTRMPGLFRGPARPWPRSLSRSIWGHLRTPRRAVFCSPGCMAFSAARPDRVKAAG